VQLGLRPLREMENTAGAIAAGDLSRRIEHTDEHTEVGRLAIALNEILQQIERAFDQRAASEERLRRFVADASHELRTPLTSIRGYTELWRGGGPAGPPGGGGGTAARAGGLTGPGEVGEAMRRMEQEARRMGLLVDDLLLLARLDQGRPLETVPLA